MSDYKPTAEETENYTPSAEGLPVDDGNVTEDYGQGEAAPVEPERATELQTAQDLVKAYGDQFRFDVDSKRFLIWTGRAWELDHKGQVARWTKIIARRQGVRFQMLESKVVDRHVKAMETAHGIRDVQVLASTEPGIPIRREELDADPWMFNTRTAVIDLRTGQGRKQCKGDLLSIVAPVDYDPRAEAKQFHAFMYRIFDGNADLMLYVQKLLGMCLTGDVREQLFHVFHGNGSNGKSTLLDKILAIMGDYAGEAPESLLTIHRHGEHPTELAGLLGKRLIVASETEDESKLRTQLVKKLTGDARITARFMRQDYFTFKRTFKLVLMTNHAPKIEEDSEATRRRIRLVPFEVVIPKEERDLNLPAKLAAEDSGILNWMIEGCLLWQREGLKAPAEVDAASATYFAENDRGFADFIAQCTMIYDGARATRADLYSTYEQHCQRIGERNPMSANTLYERVRRLPKVKDISFRQDDKVQRGFAWITIALGGVQ